MVLVSYSGKEINAKIVFYGPGLCGKTTNLEYIYGSIPSTSRGKMVSMKTKTERTLFFDFLPLNLGELAGFKTRFLLYTVPGQVYYNATRKLVLKGVDAVIFVADSQRGKMDENIESFQNLQQNLAEHGLSLGEIPYVIQYNKRDLADVHSVDELEHVLNKEGVPSFEAVATTGEGVFETFKACSKLLLARLSKEIGAAVVKTSGPAPSAAAVARAAAGAEAGQRRPAAEPAALRESPLDMSFAPPVAKPAATPSAAPEPLPPARAEQQAPAAASSSDPEAPGSLPADQRKTRGLWRWLRKEESEEAEALEGEEPRPQPAVAPEITWQPAPPPRPTVAPAAASRPASRFPERPAKTTPEPPPAEIIQGAGFLTAEPENVPPETIEIDPVASEQAPAPAADGAQPAPAGIPGLERSSFAAMPPLRPRAEKPAPLQPVERRPVPRAPEPERASAAEPASTQNAAPSGRGRDTLRPFVAGPSDVEEIVVPVVIPRTAIRDRVEIRLVLRIVQELDAPGQGPDSHDDHGGLAASA
jgi:mutual gliding-motility protein MglA